VRGAVRTYGDAMTMLLIELPDFLDWLHTLLRIKNFLLIAIVAIAVLATLRRDGKQS
jgi:uncharacterized protein involved in cysteine biosynthesis